MRDDYHVYAVEWTDANIKHFVDGTLYQVLDLTNPADHFGDLFHKPFFILLNLAVGGGPVRPPDASTVWPQQMAVDWVRVYQR